MNSSQPDSILRLHRARVAILFIDLRGFTCFSEKESPEEVMEVLSSYYKAVGTAALKYQGTLGHLAGDGIMVFFNDPDPVPHYLDAALQTAVEARDALNAEKKKWDSRSYNLDFGIGLAEGFVTIGEIGFDEFSQYSVIGAAVNFASRLCSVADKGQILVSRRYRGCLERDWQMEPVGDMNLKGVAGTVSVFNVLSFGIPQRQAT